MKAIDHFEYKGWVLELRASKARTEPCVDMSHLLHQVRRPLKYGNYFLVIFSIYCKFCFQSRKTRRLILLPLIFALVNRISLQKCLTEINIICQAQCVVITQTVKIYVELYNFTNFLSHFCNLLLLNTLYTNVFCKLLYSR